VGFETLSEKNLRQSNKKQNLGKDYQKAIKRLHDLGIMITLIQIVSNNEWFLLYLQKKITKSHTCSCCSSTNIVKNGSGNPKYKCKDCGVFKSLRKSEEEKEMLIRASQERCSSRGLGRIFGISHQTALNWIKKKAEAVADVVDTLLPYKEGDILELDELWSFVQ